jgi:hypothetical protein
MKLLGILWRRRVRQRNPSKVWQQRPKASDNPYPARRHWQHRYGGDIDRIGALSYYLNAMPIQELMIHSKAEFQQTLDQLERMQRALSDLRERVLPVNPQLFAVMAEGPLDYIRQFHEELEEYRSSLLAPTQAT